MNIDNSVINKARLRAVEIFLMREGGRVSIHLPSTIIVVEGTPREFSVRECYKED